MLLPGTIIYYLRNTIRVLYPFLFILTFILLVIETVAYPGFISTHTFMDVRDLFWLSIIFFSIYRYVSGSANPIFKFLNRLIYILTAIIWIMLVFFLFQEQQHYSNYVFSTYHINLSGLLILAVFLGLCTLQVIFIDPFNLYRNLQNTIHLIRYKPQVLLSVILFFLLLFLAGKQIRYICTELLYFSQDMMKVAAYDDQEKFIYKLGGNQNLGWIMTYANFITSHTPPNAKIMIPPQTATWPLEGNQAYFRWFVYPRELIQSNSTADDISEEVEYLLIAHGTKATVTEHTWPRLQISKDAVETITFIDRSTLKEVTLTDNDYIPNYSTEKWGVIRLRKRKND